jgi:SPP1 family predicted phage head-tail adaptor
MMKAKAEAMKDLAKVRRRKIIIQKRTITEDDIGNQIEVWQDWKTLKAEKTSLWGQEYYAAKAVNEQDTIVFTVRYVAFIDEMDTVDYRVIFDGKTYDIKNIDHVNDDIWVKIKVLRSAADG